MQCKNNVNRGVFLKNTGCGLCNRKCRVDRDNGEKGFCGETSEIRCGRAALHMWEEPCISGTRGSGTVFFTGCVLKCVFCQNSVLAESKVGKPVTVSRLAEIFLELQRVHTISTWSRPPILFRQSGRALSFQRKMDFRCLLYIIRGVMSPWIQ